MNADIDFHFFLSNIIRPIISDELDRKFEEIQRNLESSPKGDEHFSVKQAAEFLGVSQHTIYNNIRKIPHAKRLGRLYFLRSELEGYIASGKLRQL